MSSLERAFVIIPAFNEERQVGEVIEAAQAADPFLIDTEHVVLVDNNSKDRTAYIAESMGAMVIGCEEQGKAPAMAEGARVARTMGATALTFLDADLINLKGSHVNQLTEPVLEGKALMTIGYLGGRKSLAKEIYKRWGMFAGQRCIDVEVWDSLRPWDLRSFRTEGALNAVLRNSGQGEMIKRLELDNVYHIGKREKYKNPAKIVERSLRIELSAILGVLFSRSHLRRIP